MKKKYFRKTLVYVNTFIIIGFVIAMIVPTTAIEVAASSLDSEQPNNTYSNHLYQELDNFDKTNSIDTSIAKISQSPIITSDAIATDLASLLSAISNAPTNGSVYTITIADNITLMNPLPVSSKKTL